MTNKKRKINQVAPFACLVLIALSFLYNAELKAAIINGMNLAALKIIPTLFPFFVLSDFCACTFTANTEGKAARFFTKVFGISGSAMPIWIMGLVCGFPLAVKSGAELVQSKKISVKEFERLCGFSNNPSLAFVIFGVGAGILSSEELGIMLYISVIISSLITGLCFRKSVEISKYSEEKSRQSFNLVNSIKFAGINSISVASYIIFFSGVIGLMSQILSEQIMSLISPFVEVSNSVKMIYSCNVLTPELKLPLIAFALGFSGLSVHLQSFSFFPNNAKKDVYLIMKLFQGIICAVLCFLFSHLCL